VGTKAVNALSVYFKVQSYRDGKTTAAEFERGELTKTYKETSTLEPDGTSIVFTPDDTIFKNYHFIPEYIENQLWNYAYLNSGLTINYNDRKFFS
jgi:topoisomerase-4 subunit B